MLVLFDPCDAKFKGRGDVRKCLNPLTPTKKSSYIFVKNSEIIGFGPRKSKPLEIFRYLFSLPKYEILAIFGFLNSVQIFDEQFLPFFPCKAKTHMNSTLLNFVDISYCF